ncbi:MAG TPA: hypothetical protein VKO18_15735 [Terriglobia bacterium]|nr:hypothetical protein [Terriglobia bacterium]
MPDNQVLISARLGKLGLGIRREEEIVRELGEHLADHAAALETGGVAKEAAAQEAFASVLNWPELRDEILSAETEETTMNYRTKVLWLPALCALTLSNGLVALMQIFGRPPDSYWLSTAGKSMVVIGAFMVPWLISQSVVGAVTAYWSRRAGGTVRHQLLAALSPAIVLLGLFVVVIPFSIILDKHAAHHIRLSAFLLMTVIWVLLPAVPLLLGAAPFLRKPQRQAQG